MRTKNKPTDTNESTKRITPLTKLGLQGEALVAHYLEQQGFTLLARNYTTRFGELDLVAQKGNIVAFVEVKTRRNPYFAISMTITPSKQRKIGTATKHFILQHKLFDHVWRFDVATLTWAGNDWEIEYIPNAFTLK